MNDTIVPRQVVIVSLVFVLPYLRLSTLLEIAWQTDKASTRTDPSLYGTRGVLDHVQYTHSAQAEEAQLRKMPVEVHFASAALLRHTYPGAIERWTSDAPACRRSLDDCSCRVTVDDGESAGTSADVVVFDRALLIHAPRHVRRLHPRQLVYVLWHEQFGGARGLHEARSAILSGSYDGLASFRLDSEMPIPYGCNAVTRMLASWDSHVGRAAAKANSRRPGLIAAFISNCEEERMRVLDELSAHVHIDNYGGCRHNVNRPPDRSNASWETSKVDTLRRYKFAIAFENAVETDYVTEKVWDALSAGAIPVYLGAPNIADHVPGASSIINIADFKSMADVAAHILSASTDMDKLALHFQWDRQAMTRYAEAYCMEPFVCRMCRAACDRQAQPKHNSTKAAESDS